MQAASADDYDEINEDEFQKYMGMERSIKKNEAEIHYEYKLKFYFDTNVNFYDR